MNTLDFILLTAAVWRLSNLIAHKEKGPFRIVWSFHIWVRKMARKHTWFKKSEVLEGIECEYCLSIWFGTILGGLYLFLGDAVILAIFPLALSTGAILIKHTVFLIKSVDTRYDQQNQSYLKQSSDAERPIAVELSARKTQDHI